MTSFRIKAIATTIITIVLVVMVTYAIISVDTTWNDSRMWQAESVEYNINKALLQCYSLEGSYPTEIEHLSSYGIILNNDMYNYTYEFVAYNIKPKVRVVEK